MGEERTGITFQTRTNIVSYPSADVMHSAVSEPNKEVAVAGSSHSRGTRHPCGSGLRGVGWFIELFWPNIPVSRFSLTAYDCTTRYVVFRLLIGHRRPSTTNNECLTRINPSVVLNLLVGRSQPAAEGAKLERGGHDSARKTTSHKRIRSQPGWITISMGSTGYIRGEDFLRVRDRPFCQLNPLTHVLFRQPVGVFHGDRSNQVSHTSCSTEMSAGNADTIDSPAEK